MRLFSLLVLVVVFFTWSFFILGTHQQLQSSQKQVLLQLRKQLEYPKQLEIWFNTTTDLCYLSSLQVNITCQNNFVTEIRIVGDSNANKVINFNGFALPGTTLSGNFSMDSFVATLARLNSLRLLSLISVGIWGPLPDKIHRFYSLEYLDLSGNYLFGSLPNTVPRLVKLQTVTLDGNYFNGTFPNWFGSLANLTNLSLSHNEISGKLPDLSGLATLQVLDLSDNRLNSRLPNMPTSLVMVSLSNNSFSGGIPQQYRQLHRLQKLDMSFNSLTGLPPAALFSLQNITFLNFASNLFSGSLASHISCGSGLEFVDISDNRITGQLPSCLSSALDKRAVKSDGNCLSNDLVHQDPPSYCVQVEIKEKDSRRNNVVLLVGVIGGIFVVMMLLVCGLIVLCRRSRETSEQHLLHKSVPENSITKFPSEIITSARFILESTKLSTQGAPVHRLFSLEELKDATRNFHRSTLIGEGSNGKIYKGKLENGTQVAIRRLAVSKKYTLRNLKLRLDLLAKLRHPHLACLLGNCIDGEVTHSSGPNKVYLVYEYVPGGNYHAHLSENNPEKILKWSDRLGILIGVAKAVHFLHTGLIPGFFNNRLKANNVLLNEHGMAKLIDYGLSIVADENDKHEAKGEDGESWQMKSLEDDVYSFGFILLESIVGPSFSARKEAFVLNEMVCLESQEGQRQIVDPQVLASCSQESLSVVISITSKCISLNSSNRPSFEDVLWNLQYAAQIQANADGDQR